MVVPCLSSMVPRIALDGIVSKMIRTCTPARADARVMDSGSIIRGDVLMHLP